MTPDGRLTGWGIHYYKSEDGNSTMVMIGWRNEDGLWNGNY